MVFRRWRCFWWVGVLVLIFGVLYGLTAARLPLGYADSDDLLLAASEGSIAHPPGYRLLVQGILGFLRWVPTDNLAFLGHFSSSVLQALSVGLLALVLTKVLPKRNSLKQHTAAFLGASAWGLSKLTWLHGTVLEVFPLAQVLVLVFILCILQAKLADAVKRNWWEWVAIFFGGLAVFYHQLVIVLVFLFWIWYLRHRHWRGWKKIGFGTLGLFGLLFVSYGLPALETAAYGWDPGDSMKEWWRFWSRQVYASGGSAVETYLLQFDLEHSVRSMVQWVRLSVENFTAVGFLLGLAGLVYWWQNDAQNRQFGVLWLGYGVGLAAFMKFPLVLESAGTEYFLGTALRLRMLFVSELLFGLGLGFGVWWLLVLSQRYWRFVVGGILVVLIGFGVSRFEAMNASTDNAIFDLSNRVLSDLPEKAVLVVDTDMAFSLLYQHIVLGTRADVSVVPVTTAMRQEWFERQEGVLYDDRFNQLSWQMSEVVVTALRQERRVFLYHPSEELEQFLGLEGNPLFAWPFGYLVEVRTEAPQEAAAYDYGFSKSLAAYEPSGYTWWSWGLKEHLATVHTQLGYYWIRAGLVERGKQQLALARELSQLPQTEAVIGRVEETALSRFQEQDSYLGYETLTPQKYLDQAKTAGLAGKQQEAVYFASRAVMASGGETGWWEYFKRVVGEGNEVLRY